MKKNKFSKDQVENIIIGMMSTDDYLNWYHYGCTKQQLVLYYFKDTKNWGFCEYLTDPRSAKPRPWVEMKDHIINFLNTNNPDFERILLRKKAILDFIDNYDNPSKNLEAL